MIIFYLVLALGLGGIGFVFWNLKNDTEQPGLAVEKIDPAQISSFDLKESLNVAKKFEIPAETSKPKLKISFSFSNLFKPLQNILGKIKSPAVKNKQSFDLKTEETYLLKDKFSQNPFNTLSPKQTIINSANPPAEELSKTTSQPKTFTPTPLKPLNSDEIKKIEAEIDLTAELKELKTKHERLEKIFQERNVEFERNQEALNNELKNRKEFNKVKDLLEKELKEAKNQTRDAQAKLNLVFTESEGHKKRNELLEEKITKLEKDNIKKEEEIDTLVKRLQTFASPMTSATPPRRELPGANPPQADSVTIETKTPEISKPVEIVPEIIIPPATEVVQPIIENSIHKDSLPDNIQNLTSEAPNPTTQDIENTAAQVISNDNTPTPTSKDKDSAEDVSLNESATIEKIPFLKLKPDITHNHEPPKDQI